MARVAVAILTMSSTKRVALSTTRKDWGAGDVVDEGADTGMFRRVTGRWGGSCGLARPRLGGSGRRTTAGVAAPWWRDLNFMNGSASFFF